MNTFTLKTFGVTYDILGGRKIIIKMEGQSVEDLRHYLNEKYPQLKNLNSLFIAVNQKYAHSNVQLNETDEIALIPPVSGG